jgi:DeoR/GlpR family transcriptional regulator of sugar metabolism
MLSLHGYLMLRDLSVRAGCSEEAARRYLEALEELAGELAGEIEYLKGETEEEAEK